MITNSEAFVLAAKKAKELFGAKYLKENKKHMTVATSEQNNICYLFLGIKTIHDCPNLTPNRGGWTVYAEIYVNTETGKVLTKDYQTE